ncbi:MAG: hydrogenase maturation protease [Candidatus Xenobiia bacterium LiM19]
MKVLGCGNSNMGDDGFGSEVIRILMEKKGGESLEPIEVSWGGISILDHFEGEKKVIILDAMKLGAPPGTIHRFNSDNIPMQYKGNYATLHELGVLEAVTIGRYICPEKMPDEIMLIGVEALEMKPFCLELSEPVRKSIPAVLDIIMQEALIQ